MIGGVTPADRGGSAESLAVWALLSVVGIEIFVTYTRIPVRELYHVRSGGLGAGVSRLLAYVGFPVGPIVVAVVGVVVDRVPRRSILIGAAAGVMLAAAVAWPGALDEAGLDAPAARALAAVGVAVGLLLTLSAARAAGRGSLRPGRPGDRLRPVVAATFLVGALPWMAADLGLSLDRLPAISMLFQTDALARQPGVSGLHPAVHDGHHHGMDGVLLVLASLMLSRALARMRHRRFRLVLGAYLSFLFVYGAANAIQDFWLEQIVKRGWTDGVLPMMLVPSASVAWVAIVGTAAVGFVAVLLWRSRSAALDR